MKRFVAALALIFTLGFAQSSPAYIGVGVGVVDESEFGYGLLFGGKLGDLLGLDFQIVGFADTGVIDNYWLQTNADLAFDFNFLWKRVSEKIELHPYVKAGFTYGAMFFKGSGFDVQAAHGPGFNIGFGVDWKLLSFLTVGVDMTQSFIYLDGVTVNNVQLAQDSTAKVFNFLAGVKFFAY